jgi:outer membrane receptor protein involved in Fe transport
MVSYGYAPGEVPYWPEEFRFPNAQFGFNTDGTLFTQGNFGSFNVQIPAVFNFKGAEDPVFFNEYLYSYNYAPLNALQLPLERNSAFVRGAFEVSDSMRVYAQGLYADYSAIQQLAPTPLVDVFMPVDNPFVPPDLALLLASRPTPDQAFSFEKRVSETGPRIATSEYDVYQATLGVSGTVFEAWKYELYAQIGANDQVQRQTSNLLTSKIEELTFAPDGGVSICGGFDPFGLGSISPECLAYISTDASNHAEVDQTIAEASVSGPLIAFPAGDLKAAFGVFYKEDKYRYAASPAASAIIEASPEIPFDRLDIQGFSASADVEGDDHNLDLYAEVLVPLLRDAPAATSLEAVIGYRLSDYASAGSFDSWKAELLYQPIDAVRLRGSYQQAVRAASVVELYSPQLPTTSDFFNFPGQIDPCAADSPARTGSDGAQIDALCLAQGIPASVLPGFLGSEFVTGGVNGGNPDLGPEEATTSTIGVVWTPRLASDLFSSVQISLDWYEIDITDKIEQVLFSDFGQFCYDRRYNPELSVTSQWCAMFSRNPISGRVDAFQELARNAFDWKTSGVDAQLDWRFDVGPGQVGVNWLLSWLDSFTTTAEGSVGTARELAGTIGFDPPTRPVGASLPEWKSNLQLSYRWRDLTVGAAWRFIDSMTDLDPSWDPQFEVPQVDYFDVSANYEFASGFLDGLRIWVGVENVTDEDPPIFPSYINANTDPSQYDAFGRRYYASLRYSF